MSDLKAMRDYINALSRERTFITFQGEQISLDNEKKYLENFIKKIKKNQAIKLIAFAGNKLIGVSDVELSDRIIEKHVGTFGITIHKDYRGEGIGKLLMKLTLENAKRELRGMKIVTLGVFGNNIVARKMYQKFGFKNYSKLPKGILHRGKYVDHYEMYKKLSDK